MSTRQERQRQKTLLKKMLLKKKIQDPSLRRIAENEIARGAGTEVYRLDDDGSGNPMYFNVSAMRDWVKKNCEKFSLPVDLARAQRLIESGAVDPDHIRDHTIRTEMEPIIVCRGILGADQIVDGAHRFVAACMGAAMLKIDVPIPGYVLHPEAWRQFILPANIAEALGSYN